MASWTASIREFLEAHRVGHLATAGADGAPHVIPVCYALHDSGLYFVADAKPKRGLARDLLRLRNLRANPRAAFVVDTWDEDWRRLAWVLVRGPARLVDTDAEHAEALRRLRARYLQYRAMALDDPAAYPVVSLEAERIRHWRATPPRGG